jgi:thiol-disulfide isomerase/thioredoxin
MKKKLLCLVWLLFLPAIQGAPANDNFDSAEILSGMNLTRTTSNQGATGQIDEPGILHNSPQASVWYQWTAPADGLLVVSTSGSSFDTLLAVFAGSTLNSLTALAQNDDARDSTSMVSLLVTNGATYRICVDGYEGDTGVLQFSLALQAGVTRPPNDNYANATPLIGSNMVINASNFLATTEPGELTPVSYGGASVWWTWEPPLAGRYVISTEGSDFDTILAVYVGQTLLVWNDNTETNRNSSVRVLNATPGVRYSISVQGYAGASGSIHLEIKPLPPNPAPAFTFSDYNSEVINFTNYHGKVVLLNFWATWCQPCLDEMPTLTALQDKFGPEGFAIIGICTDANGYESVAPAVEQYNINYPMTIMNSDFEQGFGPILSIPTTVLIDRDNSVVERYSGAQTAATFEEIIRQLVSLPTSLQATFQSSKLVLRWPSNATGYHLQSAASLAALDWTNLSAQVTFNGDQNVVTIPATNAARLFRLIRN